MKIGVWKDQGVWLKSILSGTPSGQAKHGILADSFTSAKSPMF